MGQIIVRNLDDQVIAALKERAARKGVSMEEEVRQTLTHAAGVSREETLRELDAIRARIGRIEGPSIVEDLRRERARDNDI